MDDVRRRTRERSASFASLELPGGGATPRRLGALFDLARHESVSVARLVEAHTDAVAILAEADRTAEPDAVYGVWASQSATTGVTLNSGQVSGVMGFASGLGVVDRALVVASTTDLTGSSTSVLVDVDVAAGDTVSFDTASWSTPALIDTATGSVTFDRHRVDRSPVGPPGFYLDRVGFWHGACAPAACWAGAAAGLIDAALARVDHDPHRRAHTGALVTHDWTLRSLLDVAGRAIDDDPTSSPHAEHIARSLRFSVTGICRDVLDRCAKAFGPRLVVADADLAARCIDLELYLRQHHAERELGALVDVATHDR